MFSKIALILLVFFLISCGQEGKSVSDKVVNETKESVFIVEGLACGKSSIGTGVLISNGILTNAHVIAGTEKLEVIDVNGARSETYPISVDFETDLALLRDPGFSQPRLQTAEPKEKQRGSLIVGGKGFVNSVPVKILRLLKIVIADIYGEGKHTRSGMELSAEVISGDSGGPIINIKGQIIGLIFSRSTIQDGVSYGISSAEFTKVTESYDLSGVSSGKCRE